MATSNSQFSSYNPPLSDSTHQVPKYLQKFPISQECEHLMSTLPTAKGWLPGLCYQYQGYWYDPQILQSTLNFQKHFEAHDTDILLLTPPKSGTIWLKALTYALANREKYPTNANNYNRHPLLTTNPHDLVPFLERNLYHGNPSPDLSSLTSRIFSTHVPFISLPESMKNKDSKIVYLFRNLKDTFVSHWHFTNKWRPQYVEPLSLEEMLDMFCMGQTAYGPVWDHIHEYVKEAAKEPTKILLLRYEELKEKPQLHLKRLAEFIGYPISTEEEKAGVVEEILKLCSFDSLVNMEVNKNGTLSTGQKNNIYFRKGEVGDWKNYMTLEQASRIDQILEQKFGGCSF